MLSLQQKADIAASFQFTAGEHVAERAANALDMFRRDYPGASDFIIAGGVAANRYLRGRLEKLAGASQMKLSAPPVKLCTDNAVMIAWAGIERLKLGLTDGMDFEPKARWPVYEL